jgi:endonuclease/exonuclease/phosphatase (EEP) superfamily protein YafD
MLKFIRLLCRIFVILLAAVVLVVTLLGMLPLRIYWIDMLSQLRLPYIIAAVAVLLLCSLCRTKIGTVFGALALLINLVIYCSLYLPSASSAEQPHGHLKIIASNIYGARNQDYDALVQLVHVERPDVLAITEMTPKWILVLKKRLPEYTTEFDEKLSGGAAIFSRVPITRVPTPPAVRRYGVRGVVEIDGHPVLLIASHPPAPWRIRGWQIRNLEFMRLAEDVHANPTTPIIIAGDLNCTPWSAYFQRLMQSTQLADSEQGVGPQPSWSTHMYLPLVPIDHCLHTRNLTVTERRLGPNIGSDHLPLIVTLAVR